MWVLAAAIAAVGGWWYLSHQTVTTTSPTSQTPGQPTTLPLSSGGAPVEVEVPGITTAPGSLDRFLGPPVRVPLPMTQLPVRPAVGVIAQLQADTAQQRLATYYANYPMRYQRTYQA